jgi:very-short-patch-repair endonuclease
VRGEKVRGEKVRGARSLRKGRTDAERKLWLRLRDRRLSGAKFRRQHPVGPFVVDFACLESGLVVELDGSQHALRRDADAARTSFLEERGFRVPRSWQNDVLTNLDGVLVRIAEGLRTPPPAPLPRGERENETPKREREDENPRPRKGGEGRVRGKS